MSTLTHPQIGQIKGLSKDDTTQYLGIPYGTLTSRFATAVPPSYPSASPLDATQHAPTCLQPPGTAAMEQGLIQQPLSFTDRSMSDLTSLCLSITVPANTPASAKLPVFAFVHGGGFALGSTTWPQYDFARLVRMSVERGTPMIGVGINYRVGVPGFLYGKDMGEAGYKPNRGLADQQLALKWVKKYIGGFGGDGDNVTLGGESAGGAAVTYHLHQEEALFRRAVPMSGSDLLVKSTPLEVAEGAYQKAVELLGLQGSGKEKVAAMEKMEWMEMLGKLGMAVQTGPVVDGEIVKFVTTYESLTKQPLPGATWSDLLIGDCTFDGSILGLRIGGKKDGIAGKFVAAVEKTLPAETAKQLLSIYNISASTDDDTAFILILRFMNDIGFYAPLAAYAANFVAAGRNAYVYHFNVPNPWDGMWKGEANHILDVAYLFQNYNEKIPSDAGREVAKKMGATFIDFVVGKAPLEKRTSGGGKAVVFGEDSVQITDDVPTQTGRREAFEKLGREIGFDALDKTFGTFLMS
ncbi:hypothetical protein CAC42_3565 [Sphaceloma murrayae]|uniref:Carboxylic ester hydrolase n=1 Tax=Sphaceloma murrayae TaxID=2082308 RepID=A0A2K1QT58_9PEZI|nr:hypothetical protein CAC42_3565 [Sphaceloma murrayae]